MRYLRKDVSMLFEGFPKIARLKRDVIVTEKLDGTNAQICVGEDGTILAGSRNRWLTLDNDNYGFAAWVKKNEEDLSKLGPGRHFGEWWGSGIQRSYGLTGGDRRFSLFNIARYSQESTDLPACCSVVPVLCTGKMDVCVKNALWSLTEHGSVAAPGFMKPEGIVVYHIDSKTLFKATLENDETPKRLVG